MIFDRQVRYPRSRATMALGLRGNMYITTCLKCLGFGASLIFTFCDNPSFPPTPSHRECEIIHSCIQFSYQCQLSFLTFLYFPILWCSEHLPLFTSSYTLVFKPLTLRPAKTGLTNLEIYYLQKHFLENK